MDPLSIIASTIAIATPVTVCLRKARDNRHAKEDLVLLSQEIGEIVVLLEALSSTLSQHNNIGTGPCDAQLLRVLLAAKAKLMDLSQHLMQWDRSCTNQASVRSRAVIWTMIGAKVKSFKDELSGIRFQLITVVSTMNLSGTTRVEMTLQQMVLLMRMAAQDQSSTSANLRADLAKENGEIRTLLHGLTARQATTNSSIGHDDTGHQAEPGIPATPALGESAIKAFHHNGSILFETAQMTAAAAVGIRAVHFPRTSCTPWCSCICHREYRFRSPRFLDSLLGSLYICSSGFSLFAPSCNEVSCHLKAQPLACVTYFFPKRFVSRMISCMMTVTPLAGPVASLKVQRTVAGTADIFTYAKLGDVDRIKSLFIKGLASPHDVCFESGITPLHMAINHQHIAVCEFLLKANADPFLSDFTQCTPADSAWTKIFSRCLPSAAEKSMRDIFSETECIERRELAVIHKIVLGLVNKNLEQELQASTADIDAQDSVGRTALSLAAERGDAIHVRTLLAFRANPNLATHSNQTPLHYAASAKEPCCIELLLQAGADVDCLTNWQQTPLHLAAAYARNAEHAEVLIKAGADINKRDRDGMTPLHWTAISNNIAIASVLLNNPDVQVYDLDLHGSSTISQCIRNNRHRILRLLARHRPVVKECFRKDEAVLDVVLTSADAKTLDLLMTFDLVDLTTEQELKRVVCDIVRDRPELDLAIKDFSQRLSRLQNWTIEPEEAEEAWIDALEYF